MEVAALLHFVTPVCQKAGVDVRDSCDYFKVTIEVGKLLN
jgi:hypothetical protein